jgi:glycerophosphoryl diester phosphodiesterase
MEVKNSPGDPGFEPDHRLALEAAERSRPGDVVTGFNQESLAAVRRTFENVTTGLCIPAGVGLDQAVELCLGAGHEVLVPELSLIAGEINVPLAVFPWTVNDPARARELVEWGVTGIITDDPGLMSTSRSPE